MELSRIILSIIYFSVPLSYACPVYQCGNLTQNMCMSWNNGSIILNSNGCTNSKLTCNYADAIAAYNSNPLSGNYYCQPISNTPTELGYRYCGTKIPSKQNLYQGSYPKSCSAQGYNDKSCLLQDGSYAQCQCGLDSKLYCQPTSSSSIFDSYWANCEQNQKVVDVEFFTYYKSLYNYYVQFNTRLGCSQQLFKEFSELSGPAPARDYSLAMSIGIAIYLSVI
jgi:hypothetical protein